MSKREDSLAEIDEHVSSREIYNIDWDAMSDETLAGLASLFEDLEDRHYWLYAMNHP